MGRESERKVQRKKLIETRREEIKGEGREEKKINGKIEVGRKGMKGMKRERERKVFNKQLKNEEQMKIKKEKVKSVEK